MTTTSIDILLKSITLLHRETLLAIPSTDTSCDLVKTIVDIFDTNDKSNQYVGGDATIVSDLKNTASDMIDNPESYDEEAILSTLGIVLKDKPEMITTITKTIAVTLDQSTLKRTIITLRNRLTNYRKKHEINAIVSKAAYEIKTGKTKGVSSSDYIAKFITELEALSFVSTTKDPGIVDDLDIGNETGISEVITKASNSVAGGSGLVTGWEPLNDMIQGSFRRGTMVMINALQHSYKSGFVQSLVCQLATNNVPVMDDDTKKPLILFISFEDDAIVFIEFMYRYLYFNENAVVPDMTNVNSGEAANYIKTKLSVNGYHVKMLRVNPNEWTYKNIFNKVLEYEAAGYEIHACLIDYLFKLPTTGCIAGATGADVKDLFNRCRNFFSAHNILLITPHQLSTEAKQLIRNGVPGTQFVKEVVGKGYTEASKAIDQVVDLEIILHKTMINKQWHLTVGRGKDRRPSILADDKMFFALPFPLNAPIPETSSPGNVNQSTTQSDAEDDFDF